MSSECDCARCQTEARLTAENEGLAERVEHLEAENEALRGKIQAAREVCTASRDLVKWTNKRTAGMYAPAVPINDILAVLGGDA